jgi:hypothetical protein
MTSSRARSARKAVDRVSADLVKSAMDLDRLGLIDQHRLARIKALPR